MGLILLIWVIDIFIQLNKYIKAVRLLTITWEVLVIFLVDVYEYHHY